MTIDPAQQTISIERQTAPHRQFNREAVPLGTANPHEDMMPIATAAVARIRDIRNAQCSGSYVFGADDGRVFVVRQGSATGERMVKKHPAWLMGVYAGDTADGRRATFPTPSQLFGDLLQHFVDLRFVSAADIYEHIRAGEG
ncbi:MULTISPECIES: hypothetical protein [Xanthomonas]|uniref:Uncharacterized protein n=1 Tax=Xanthomonas dyei TaxID=743699 RepID=A0ABZ0D3H0_9XANT|nr:hypothetical protein [Xanthomonas dyei]WOB24760.1 hypothetical protein NYR99_13220 [Xanthomonas dyei]WOB52388.1 hypothetical protein NYR95_13225 [Xanthomonas dyei]